MKDRTEFTFLLLISCLIQKKKAHVTRIISINLLLLSKWVVLYAGTVFKIS